MVIKTSKIKGFTYVINVTNYDKYKKTVGQRLPKLDFHLFGP